MTHHPPAAGTPSPTGGPGGWPGRMRSSPARSVLQIQFERNLPMMYRGGAYCHGHAQKAQQAPQRPAMSGTQSGLGMQREDVSHPCSQLQCICIASTVSSSARNGSWGWFSPARSAPVNFDVLSSSTCKQPEIELPPISLTRACFHDRPCSCSNASSASPCPSIASKVKLCMVSKACAGSKAAHFGHHLLGLQDRSPAKLIGWLRMAGHTLQSEAFSITLENP